MTIVAVQARLGRTSLLPEDVVVNTFHFFASGANATEAQALEIADKVIAFYNTAPTGVTPTAGVISTFVSRLPNACEVRVYDLSVPTPRPLLFSKTFTLAPVVSGGTDFPAEVAIVLSLQALRAPGAPLSRHRGRVYIGPVGSNTVGGNSGGDLLIAPPTRQRLVDAGVRMMGGNADLIRWGVYSRVDNAIRGIVSASCDDRYDTQRRRGADPTSKIIGNAGGGI